MTRTPEEVRAELRRKGISIAQWALANKFSVNLVLEVLRGRPCLRGQSHKIAVKLGLKEGEVVEDNRIADSLSRRTA